MPADDDAGPIRTKIVATLGPAVEDEARLRDLIAAGVDVCRLNFSHGTLDEHAQTLARVRRCCADLHRPVAVLGDLGGPKIRVGQIDEDNPDGGLRVRPGDELVVQREEVVGRDGVISSTYPGLVHDVEVGDRVLIEDGLLRFLCTDKSPDRLTLTCKVGGVVKTRKGINLPGTKLNLPGITDKDWTCCDWAVENGLDYLAMSFVRTAGDVTQLKAHLGRLNSNVAVVAKIEKAEAVANIDAIVAAADGLMVARGDLGVEMDLARVPLIQKDLIARCRRAGKPAIVATQMLQSMVEHAGPTRAEVSDVANAILDGADATMLSGETSVGRFPVQSVHVMRHVAAVTERGGRPAEVCPPAPDKRAAGTSAPLEVSAAAARAARQLVDGTEATLVVVYSSSGDTARIFAAERFPVPVIALSDDPTRLRQMALHHGVVPEQLDRPTDLAALVAAVDKLVLGRNLAERGDRVVVAAGRSIGSAGTMNALVIHTLGGEAA